MSLLGMFPRERERRLAQEEATYAMRDHGDDAAAVLLMKAQQTRSAERRMVYKLARKIVQGAS